MLPITMKLTEHARQRLLQRKSSYDYYNLDDLMKSGCRWYTKEDFIQNSGLYCHCSYVCRKAHKMKYITDGKIEVIYDSNTEVALTVMEVKEKFLPITKFLRPELLQENKEKGGTENMNMKNKVCSDCGEIVEKLTTTGICYKCDQRKSNASHRGKTYIPIRCLSEQEQSKILAMRRAQALLHEAKAKDITKSETAPIDTSANTIKVSKIEDKDVDINEILKKYGYTISNTEFDEATNVLNNIYTTETLLEKLLADIINEKIKTTIFTLDQAIEVIEKKLQYEWENADFNDTDTKTFKNFLKWRRTIKTAIMFWKKLYQSSAVADINKLITETKDTTNNDVAGDTTDTATSTADTLRRYQITTETYSTILNTRKSFTRVFRAKTKGEAYMDFKKWLADRQLHENEKKTSIIELF